jgi:hypothetical protein
MGRARCMKAHLALGTSRLGILLFVVLALVCACATAPRERLATARDACAITCPVDSCKAECKEGEKEVCDCNDDGTSFCDCLETR